MGRRKSLPSRPPGAAAVTRPAAAAAAARTAETAAAATAGTPSAHAPAATAAKWRAMAHTQNERAETTRKTGKADRHLFYHVAFYLDLELGDCELQ